MREEDEKKLFDSIVHGLRSRGWSRMDAEGEALDRIDKLRAIDPTALRPSHMEGGK